MKTKTIATMLCASALFSTTTWSMMPLRRMATGARTFKRPFSKLATVPTHQKTNRFDSCPMPYQWLSEEERISRLLNKQNTQEKTVEQRLQSLENIQHLKYLENKKSDLEWKLDGIRESLNLLSIPVGLMSLAPLFIDINPFPTLILTTAVVVGNKIALTNPKRPPMEKRINKLAEQIKTIEASLEEQPERGN